MSVTTDWMSHARHGFVVTNIDLLDSRAAKGFEHKYIANCPLRAVQSS
jgi:hypothetical protein